MSRHWTPEDLAALRAWRQGRALPVTGPTPGLGAPPQAPRPANKYRNKPMVVDGERFDSKHEHACWYTLLFRQAAGEIHACRRQVPYELHAPDGTVIGRIVLDFDWRDTANALHVGDAKGGKATQTPLFRWKRKHFEAEYGLQIEIL